MKVEFVFRNVDSSDLLMNYMKDRFEKLERFEMNPMGVHVTVSMMRHECHIEVTIQEGRRKYKAISVSDDFYRSAEMCVNKLQRQLSKERRRQHDLKQRRPERSNEGKLAQLNPRMEFPYDQLYKKVG